MPSHSRRRLQRAARAVLRRTRGRLAGGRREQLRPLVRFDPEAPELLLSPHWDDAVLSCWSVLTAGARLNVVNLFAGLPPSGHVGPWEAAAELRDSRERATLRMQEDTRALALAGRAPHNLALLEARHRGGREHAELQAIDRALAEQAPSASRVYAPAGIGAHADHLLARAYARQLLRAGMPVALYAELPYCITHGWPSWVEQRDPAAHPNPPAQREPTAHPDPPAQREPAPHRDPEAYWRSFTSAVPEMPELRRASVARLDHADAASKRVAIDCYELSLSYSYRRMLAEPAFHGFEVLWELGAQADGKPV